MSDDQNGFGTDDPGADQPTDAAWNLAQMWAQALSEIITPEKGIVIESELTTEGGIQILAKAENQGRTLIIDIKHEGEVFNAVQVADHLHVVHENPDLKEWEKLIEWITQFERS